MRYSSSWWCFGCPISTQKVVLAVSSLLFKVVFFRVSAGTEPNEDPAETIKREIEEETGYCAQTWQAGRIFFSLWKHLMK